MHKIYVKKLNENACIPTKAYLGDAGYDLTSVENTVVPARGIAEISTGLALELPEGYYAEIASRSGLRRRGIFPPTGIIDNGYRGDMRVLLYNFTDEDYSIVVGDRIAQLIIKVLENCSFIFKDTLSISERDGKGFGSSGK